ncbi:DUF4232 domain-containing protein [Streptomyces zagrosensis]|uniref:DUF4232 domain-containing protein n=1 Tax=Streptomyces zagrosensis TaxID=1042984 RepID=A0A7W9Q5V0_9ACTN|nr:DUF4232 domain-containing protein [Streptomyces zagrosensis]MBB5934193.1 hypothetical protein [Streptomyces zagrosensis]
MAFSVASALSTRVLRGAALAAVAAVSVTAFGAGSASAAGSQSAKSAKAVTCTTAETKVTVQKLQRPINHLLITAKNTSKKTCYAYNYAYLRFHDDAQSPAQVWKDTKPQAVVTLKPGQSAYASVQTSSAADDSNDGYYTSKLGLYFSRGDGNGSAGREVVVNLPGGKTYVNDPYVTYWQNNVDDAVNYG